MNDQGCVIGIEHIKELVDFGIKNISKHNKDLIYNKKIKIILGDGRLGCKNEGPFDCIHVGGVAEEPPEYLLKLLKDGGRLVMPLYNKDKEFIYIIDKSKDKFNIQKGLGVCFSPLTSVEEQLNRFSKKSKNERKENIIQDEK